MTEERPQQRKRSFVTDALRSITARVKDDEGGPLSALADNDRRRVLQLCYLWPLTCCGFFLPFVAFIRFRDDPDIGVHARHGLVFGALYATLAFVLGVINGVVGRIVEDWVNVSLFCGGVLFVYLAALTLLGLGWYKKALDGEDVEIWKVSNWVERF